MKKILLIGIVVILLVGTISAFVLIGDYVKVKDVDKIKSKKVCKELVEWEIYPEETDCNAYKDKKLEGSNLEVIEVNPDNLENNVYIVRYGE